MPKYNGIVYSRYRTHDHYALAGKEKFMKKPTWKERFQYWFDNRMSQGSFTLLRILIIFTVIAGILMAGLIILLRFNGNLEADGVIWDSFATLINAWMPYYEEGSIGYLIIMALSALCGLLVTSVLIGIITSAMEEKIMNLRKGNSIVIEEGHIVVIGFYPGEYTLIRQLILAAGKDAETIVIGSELERDEIEGYIHDNIDIPDNVRIICRTVDPFDPASVEKLALRSCRTVIISPAPDFDTVKILLAVSSLISSADCPDIRVNSIISKEENRFPPSIAAKHNVTALQTNDVLARIIAHSCTQSGLSEVFTEIFNFEGSELYCIDIGIPTGMRFAELMWKLDRAVPVGVFRNNEVTLNPDRDMILRSTDRLLVFAENRDSAVLNNGGQELNEAYAIGTPKPERDTKVCIFGWNRTIRTVLRELPENVESITIVNYDGDDREIIERICEAREISPDFIRANTKRELSLHEIVKDIEHVIILSSHEADEDEADMETIFLLLNLRDVRTRYQLHYNITAEMRKEKNQSLIVGDDHTDFVVASNMSALFLAQLAETPEMITAFKELLSNEGNELFMKRAYNLSLHGEHTVSELRQIAFRQKYIFLGYVGEDGHCVFNPQLNDIIGLKRSDKVVVLGTR